MLKAAAVAALFLAATPALAEDGRIYNPSSGKVWGGSMRSDDEKSERDRSDRSVDIYGRDGERIGSGRVDSNGNVFSNETGRGLGQWRPAR